MRNALETKVYRANRTLTIVRPDELFCHMKSDDLKSLVRECSNGEHDTQRNTESSIRTEKKNTEGESILKENSEKEY